MRPGGRGVPSVARPPARSRAVCSDTPSILLVMGESPLPPLIPPTGRAAGSPRPSVVHVVLILHAATAYAAMGAAPASDAETEKLLGLMVTDLVQLSVL